MASKQHSHLMSLVGHMIPRLSPKLHKGQAGRLLFPLAFVKLADPIQVASVYWEVPESVSVPDVDPIR